MAATQIALRVHVTAKICFPLKSRVLISSVLYFYFSHITGEGKCFNLLRISFPAKAILLVREVDFSSMPQTRSSHWKCSRTHCCCPCHTTHRFPVLHNFCNQNTTQNPPVYSIISSLQYNFEGGVVLGSFFCCCCCFVFFLGFCGWVFLILFFNYYFYYFLRYTIT